MESSTAVVRPASGIVASFVPDRFLGTRSELHAGARGKVLDLRRQFAAERRHTI